ncbi:heavy-metal-associated domain-containing protein [Corynebacterium uropygiale]|uniref:Heavy-metal-associated domain-containing protein n=1 Tax=Corynebacterium uropygiale TaxID=1775911 RepID=A0A9X1QSQ1_9CORY|nr:heavy-metal-associated domain-containing protein [Corynebacterium uropygiale]MCF4007697.1 heavy-metal-associated domain-containing protein [Corynebacterium uropygiale]
MIKNYSVKGMSCEHCANAVKGEVGEIPGVQGVDVDLAAGLVTVTGQDFTDDQVDAAVNEAGYTVE